MVLSKKKIFEEKEKAKKLSIIEGSAYAVSESFGLRNVGPYALALNVSNNVIALLSSLPSLLGNFSQLFTYKFLTKMSRKKFVSLMVFLQAVFWLILLIPALIFIKNKESVQTTSFLLILFYTLLIVFGALAGPVWVSWMRDLVDKKELGKYFAKRSRIINIVLLLSLILVGPILDFFKKTNVLYGFFILFFFSFVFRMISAYLLTKKYEPFYKQEEKHFFSFPKFLDNILLNNFGRFVVLVMLVNFSVSIAGPFFVVYLLKEKLISYSQYMMSIILFILSSILFISLWGKISDKKGNKFIFNLTLPFISLIPLFYFLSNFFHNKILFLSIIYLNEIISGFAWSGFNLATTNFLIKNTSKEKTAICSSYLNILSGIAIFLGASFGGFIASLNIKNPILIVFIVSFIGRLIPLISVLPKIKENPQKSSYKEGFFSTIFSLNQKFTFFETFIKRKNKLYFNS